MKRFYPILVTVTVAVAVCGLMLNMTLDAGMALRGTLSRVLVGAALMGFMTTALLRPQYQRAGAGDIKGEVTEKERAGGALSKDLRLDPDPYRRVGQAGGGTAGERGGGWPGGGAHHRRCLVER